MKKRKLYTEPKKKKKRAEREKERRRKFQNLYWSTLFVCASDSGDRKVENTKLRFRLGSKEPKPYAAKDHGGHHWWLMFRSLIAVGSGGGGKRKRYRAHSPIRFLAIFSIFFYFFFSFLDGFFFLFLFFCVFSMYTKNYIKDFLLFLISFEIFQHLEKQNLQTLIDLTIIMATSKILL